VRHCRARVSAISSGFLFTVRLVAWVLLIGVVALTFVPASLRPLTPLPHGIEHFLAFFVTGLFFSLAYSLSFWRVATGSVLFSGILEFVQWFVPGRHARISDFVVGALAACAGGATAIAFRSRIAKGAG